MKAAEVINVFTAIEEDFFKATKKINEEALSKKEEAFEIFKDDLQKRLKDVDFYTILEVLEDKNLSEKQRGAIAAAYASNHHEDASGLLASLLGLIIIS